MVLPFHLPLPPFPHRLQDRETKKLCQGTLQHAAVQHVGRDEVRINCWGSQTCSNMFKCNVYICVCYTCYCDLLCIFVYIKHDSMLSCRRRRRHHYHHCCCCLNVKEMKDAENAHQVNAYWHSFMRSENPPQRGCISTE